LREFRRDRQIEANRFADKERVQNEEAKKRYTT